MSKSRTKSFRLPVEMYDAFDAYLLENEGMSPTDFIYDLLLEKLTETGHLTSVPERSGRGRPKCMELVGGMRSKARGSYYFEKKYFASLCIEDIKSDLLGNDLEVNGAGFVGGCKDCGKERKNYKVHICTEFGGTEYFIPHLLKHLKTSEYELCFRCYDIRYKALESFRESMLEGK